MKRRETIVIPMHRKKKLGSVAERTKDRSLTSLETTQFAFERMQGTLEKLAAAHNANGVELKETQIELHLHAEKLRRMQQSEERRRKQ